MSPTHFPYWTCMSISLIRKINALMVETSVGVLSFLIVVSKIWTLPSALETAKRLP